MNYRNSIFGYNFFLFSIFVFSFIIDLDLIGYPVQNRINIKPFRAYRPPVGLEATITCPPFSMVNIPLVREIAKQNAMSFLHILCPEVDLPLADGRYYTKVYHRARAELKTFVQNGLLVRDSKPAFYIYRQEYLPQNGSQSSIAVIAELHLDDYLFGRIKPHEQTKPKNERWLQGLLQTQQADVDPVMLFYKSSQSINTLIAQTMQAHPAVDFVAEDGGRHSIWPMRGIAHIKKMKKCFARLKSLYIADGHHRMLVKSKMQQLSRVRQGHRYTGKESFNYILAALYTQDEINVISYNRVVKNLNGKNPAKFRDTLKVFFDIEAVSHCLQAVPLRPHIFGMYLNGSWYRLTLKTSELQKRKNNKKNIVDTLDASILYDLILSEIPVSEDRTVKNKNTSADKNTKNSNIICVPGSLSISDLESTCKKEGYQAAFIFCPVPINDIMHVVDAHQMMLPKTTFFMPKVRSGLFVRLFTNA